MRRKKTNPHKLFHAQTEPGTSGSKRSIILFPKKNGLQGLNKPSVLIITPPGNSDNAIKYTNAQQIAKERGYVVLNKSEIRYSAKFTAPIKPQSSKEKNLTIWLECHGAIGSLLGSEPTHLSEETALKDFAEFLLSIEEKTGLKIKQIILNACNSGTEMIDVNSMSFMNSPARLLSILMPDTIVVGFIGANTTALATGTFKAQPGALTDIYQINNEEMHQLENAIVPYLDSSIAYKNGALCEKSSNLIYCSHEDFPESIRQSCAISPSASAFLACPGQEELNRIRKQDNAQKTCFGDQQLDRMFALKDASYSKEYKLT